MTTLELIAVLAVVAGVAHWFYHSAPWAPDRWWGADKIEHFVCSFLLWGYLRALGLTLVSVNIWAGAAAWGIEFIVEWPRYYVWAKRGKPAPEPYMCDLPSWRDLVYDYAGFAACELSLRLASRLL